MVTLTSLPPTPTLSYGEGGALERQLTEFILRGVGLNEAAIARHLGNGPLRQALCAEESA